MPNVDSLSIEITASATNAEKALDKLVGTIGKISASLGSVNFNGFAQGVRNISSAMQGLQNVKMPDYTRLVKGIEKIGSINSAQIQQAGKSIKELSSSLKYLDNINVSNNSKQIVELASGISKLGYKSSTQAIENIPKLATAMKQLMTTLSGVPKVSQNLIDMTNALAKLSRTGASSGRAANSLGNALNTYSSSSSKATKNTWSLASAIGKLYASYWILFRVFGKIGDAIDISSDLTEVQNVVNTTFGNMTYKVAEFAQTSIKKFGMSELTLKEVTSQFQAMGSAMNINSSSIASANKYLNEQTNGYIGLSDSMADISLNLTKLTADMASFYNVEQDVVAEDLQSIFTGTTKPLRQYGIDLTEVNLKQWAMTQGLNSNIESMTQAEKALLRYQYTLAHTGAAQGDFEKTADTWANQVRILKQNFQQLASVIGGGFINALKPLVKALNVVVKQVTEFAKIISNALGKIFGWTYESGTGGLTNDFEDAADSSSDIADNTGEAAKNINKMKQSIRAFDELKTINLNISDDSGSDGGGTASGGSGSTGTGSSGGQWSQTESMIKAFESEIDTLSKLGKHISDTLSETMESIDWNKIYRKAQGFGKGLADFLNELIKPRLFKNLGKSVANSINTAFEFLNTFGTTFNWDNFGKSLGDGLNSFVKNLNWETILSTSKNWAKGIAKALNKFISTANWNSVGKTIANGINFAVLGLGTFVKTFDWSKAAQSIADTISGFFRNVDWDNFGQLLANSLNGAAQFVNSFVANLDLGSVAQALVDGIASFFSSVDYGEFTKALFTILSLKIAISTAKGFFGAAGSSVSSSIVGAILSGTAFTNFGARLFELLSSTITNAYVGSKLQTLLSTLGTKMATLIAQGLGKLPSLLASPLGLTATAITSFFAGLEITKVNLGTMADEIEIKFFEMADGVEQAISKSKESLGSLNTISSDWAYIEEISNKYYELSKNYSNLTEEEKRLLETYYGIINEQVPLTVLNIDNTTKAYNGTKEGIDQLIQKTKELQIVQAAQEALKENTKNLFDLQFQLEQVSDGQERAKQVIQQWEGAYANSDSTQRKLLDSLRNVNFQVSDLTSSEQKEIKTLLQYHDGLQLAIEYMDDTSYSYLALTEEIENATDKQAYLTKIISTNGKAWEQNSINSTKSIQKTKTAQTELGTTVLSENQKMGNSTQTTTAFMERSFKDHYKNIGLASDSNKKNIQTDLNTLKEHYKNTSESNTKTWNGELDKQKGSADLIFEKISEYAVSQSAYAGLEAGKKLVTNFQNNSNSMPDILRNGLSDATVTLVNTGANLGSEIGLSIGNNIASSFMAKKETIQNNLKKIMSGIDFELVTKSLGGGASVGLSIIPQYAIGGFPEDGLFFANHNELVGSFSNGKTAVANNDQITKGIADAVYPAVYNAVSRAMSNNQSTVNISLEGDANGLFNAVKKEADNYTNRTGNPAFSF